MSAEVVVVVGACGGVGASTLAALLARRRAREGSTVTLVDLDPGAGGLEIVLGTEDVPGVRWADLADVRGSLAAADLVGVLPRWAGVDVLSGDRRAGGPARHTVDAVLPALVDGSATVVVDLPGHALLAAASQRAQGAAWRADEGPEVPDDGPAAPLAALGARARAVLLTGQDVRGVASAIGVRDALGPVPTLLTLRRRRRARVAPLAAAHVLDLPLLGLLPAQPSVREASDRGLGPVVGPRSRLGRAVAHLDRGLGR